MRSIVLIVEFFYLPEPLPLVGQVPSDVEKTRELSRTCQLNLMAEQIHVLHGAPLPHIAPPPVDPNWKPPYFVID